MSHCWHGLVHLFKSKLVPTCHLLGRGGRGTYPIGTVVAGSTTLFHKRNFKISLENRRKN
jgi:hypothetical protein